MAKEFQKKYMHPTRRKLVNMVLTGGEYEKNTQISLANADKSAENNRKKEIGETWTDSDGKKWEQKEFGRVRVNELSETMSDVRAYLQQLNSCKAEGCNTIKLSRADKKLISKTGFCATCLAKKEMQVKIDGLWEVYEDYKIYSNMISYGKDLLEKLNQAYKDAKQEYEFVHEDGRIEKWILEKDIDELKAEIVTDITMYEGEIEQAKKLRNEAWDKLKDKGYDDLIKAPID
jgi:hypothetical protein